MKCPYCNEEMLRGTLFGTLNRAAYWLPDDKSPIILSGMNIRENGGIILGKVGMNDSTHEKSTGHVCAQCKKMIIDLVSN